MSIYLDHNATTPPAEPVVEAVQRALRDFWANPSSVHRDGQRARQQMELAREDVASLVGCEERELIFTSGATEANNLVLRGWTESRGKRTVITTPVEHSAVREPCQRLESQGDRVVWLPVSRSGLVDPDAVDAALRDHRDDVAAVSIHWINNETGVIQPIARIAEVCRSHGVLFHTDATQAVGRVPVNVREVPVDAMSFSGHKLHGPKGVGGLFLRSPLTLRPQNLGGPHERERRGGTENTPGIIGLGEAAKLAKRFVDSDEAQRLATYRDRLETAIRREVPDAVIHSAEAPRVWNTTNVGFPYLEAEAILLLLSEHGVSAAAGAACSSGSLEPSPVLLAMGIEEAVANGSVRFSIGRETTEEAIDQASELIPGAIHKLRGTLPVGSGSS